METRINIVLNLNFGQTNSHVYSWFASLVVLYLLFVLPLRSTWVCLSVCTDLIEILEIITAPSLVCARARGGKILCFYVVSILDRFDRSHNWFDRLVVY